MCLFRGILKKRIGLLKTTSPPLFKDRHNWFRVLLALGIIWLVGAISDRIWFALDHSVPAWDDAQYLTGSLNYWRSLQHPQWFSREWWTSFWLLSSKIPPLIYITAAICQNFFGIGPDQATLIHLLFSAILLGSVYGLGAELFSIEVGLWAAGLCQLLPGLYQYKLVFLLDYPLTAMVMLSFWCLTHWHLKTIKTPRQGWLWAAAFGLSGGSALMVKQTALLFLLIPVLWVALIEIRRRRWQRILQLVGGLCLSVLVFGPWYRTNWLIVLTASKRATIDSAIAKGDPSLNTLSAWTYYWKVLPYQISWLLLLVPIVGLLLYWKRLTRISPPSPPCTPAPLPPCSKTPLPLLKSLSWLAAFWIGGYLLSCLNINKDERYVMPYLPIVAIFLAYGLTAWGYRVRYCTVGLAVIVTFLNLFPIGGVWSQGIAQVFSPNVQHLAYVGPAWPHRQVIDKILQTSPNLRSTLGVLPSTGEINQHNLNYYGALQNFQVYGRQVGARQKDVLPDARSLEWFLTKTGDQGSVPKAQAAMVQTVEQSPDFEIAKTWNLPDRSILNLYHRRVPSLEVQSLAPSEASGQVKLERAIAPDKSPPGVPVPITYEWAGSWEELQSGLVLLTWQNSQYRWLHDHGIAMGGMQARFPNKSTTVRTVERMAMLPPVDTPPGTYTLKATYINRQTGVSYPISVPPVQIAIAPSAPTPAPELDLVTQLRILAADLPQGIKAIGPIFEEIGRINQYDPIQDYVVQAQTALAYRLQMEPKNLNFAYGLALSTVLRRQVNEAIAALERVTQLDSQNPYAYAYLAFVNLYNWHPGAAQVALKSATALNPNLAEIQAFSGVASLMQGNLVKAWQHLEAFKVLSKKPAN